MSLEIARTWSWKMVLFITLLAATIIVVIFYWIGLEKTSLNEVMLAVIGLFLLGKVAEAYKGPAKKPAEKF